MYIVIALILMAALFAGLSYQEREVADYSSIRGRELLLPALGFWGVYRFTVYLLDWVPWAQVLGLVLMLMLVFAALRRFAELTRGRAAWNVLMILLLELLWTYPQLAEPLRY